ncbi:MAG: pyruvate dehydrogenase complex dihydrolipoamide acetyltransferase [Alphaproteobacteria bacterium]|nr:pyruvate dehydrogenase complex dihydrolipoamide acetyltransferase [Alphaproteobacteria bacterium]
MPVQILMPALSPTMSEGNLVKWHKKEGDIIKSGQVLAEIETDKATMEVEAVDEGVLGKIVVPEGTENVQVNALIGLILEEGEDPSALAEYKIESTPVAKETTVSAPVAEPVAVVAAPAVFSPAPSSSSRVVASPLARRIAEQSGIDLSQVSGSGPKGRIVKADVENATPGLSKPRAFVSNRPLGEMPAFESIKVSNIKKITAKRLTEAKQNVPHFYLTIECEVSKILSLRQDINDSLGEKLISVNDLILKACALSLMKVPEANASWADDHIRLYKSADISVAVATPNGLITPIIRDANQKSVVDISREAKTLFAKARDGKLIPQEFQGGTFSLSNLGMFGIQHFGAIINPPQGCILAVGSAEQKPIVRDGQITIGNVMNCTLSVDHRVVDGAVGAEFLAVFKDFISKPVSLVM